MGDIIADVVLYSDYYPFGMLLPNRNGSEEDYRYGFNGMEKDDEVYNSEGTSYDFGARLYNPRVGRWTKRDPLEATYPSHSPYCYAVNSPVVFYDVDGEYTIFVNGKVSNDGERASVSYWTKQFVNRVAGVLEDDPGGWYSFSYTGFYDGDVARLPAARYDAGVKQAKADFEQIVAGLERDENGKIVESVNLVSHSRGSAWAAGFQDAWNDLVSEEANAELFADGIGEIDFNLMLAPHQSGYINVEPSSTLVVAITHDYDPASDGAVGSSVNSGKVVNIETDNGHQAWEVKDTHTIDGFHPEAESAAAEVIKKRKSGDNSVNLSKAAISNIKLAASSELWDRDSGSYSSDN